jgi:hypothetical protein
MSVEISRDFLSDSWPPRGSLCASSVSFLGPGQSLIEVMSSFVVFPRAVDRTLSLPPRRFRLKGQEFNMCAKIKMPSYHTERKPCIDFGCELYCDT